MQPIAANHRPLFNRSLDEFLHEEERRMRTMIEFTAPSDEDARELRKIGHNFLEKIRQECWDLIHVSITPELFRAFQKDGRQLWSSTFRRALSSSEGLPTERNFVSALDKIKLYDYIQGIRTKVDEVAPKLYQHQPAIIRPTQIIKP